MPIFQYTASKLSGKIVHGQMQAANRQQLKEQLSAQNLYLASCTEKEKASRSVQRLNSQQLAEFCRELGTMLGAGIPLVRALAIMAKRDIPNKVKDVYSELYRQLKTGTMLSDAMESLSGVFPDLLISMYRASEQSGQMEQTSKTMAEHYEKSHRLKKKVSNAMVYPIILSCVTVGVLLVVFLFILPTFFNMFEQMDAELPGITQFMLNLSQGLRDHWMTVLIVALVLVLILKIVCSLKPVKYVLDMIKLRIPVVGKLLRTIYTARFARTLSSCYSSGLSMMNSLRNTRDTVGNTYIAAQFSTLLADVRGGKPLSASIMNMRGFDSKLAASIQIGEETGKLYDMLNSMADSFDYDSDIALQKMTALIEPVMIVIMAGIIGTVIVSVMLPMTSLYSAIGASA